MEQVTARFSQLVMPNDLNNIGTLFGGKMVSWMDIAAAKAIQRFLRGTEAAGGVTKAIDEVVFSEPVFGGEWVNFDATIVSAGTTSITSSLLLCGIHTRTSTSRVTQIDSPLDLPSPSRTTC